MAAQVDYAAFPDVAKRHHHALNNALPKHGKARRFEILGSEATDIGTLSNGAKLLKSGLNILALFFTQAEALKNGVKLFTGIADGVKILGIGKGAQDIHLNKEGLEAVKKDANLPADKARRLKREKTLKITSATLGIVAAGGALLKTLDGIKLINLGTISAKLGSIPRVGPFLSVGTIFNIVDIVKSVIDIINHSLKIRELNGDRSESLTKKTKWTEIAKSGMTAEQKQAKIAQLTDKIAKGKALIESEATQAKKDASIKAVVDAKAAYEQADQEQQNSKGFAHFKAKIHAYQAKCTERDAIIAYSKSELAFKALEKKTAQQEKDLDLWNKDEFNGDLKGFVDRKISKWDIKANNSRMEIVKESMGISLNSVLIVALVASTIFAGLALFGLMAVSLPVSAAFLVVSLLGIGIHFLKKYKPAERYEHVRLNEFARA